MSRFLVISDIVKFRDWEIASDALLKPGRDAGRLSPALLNDSQVLILNISRLDKFHPVLLECCKPVSDAKSWSEDDDGG
jgi:hypothetical protein